MSNFIGHSDPANAKGRKAVVIVDDVRVTYKVFASGKRVNDSNARIRQKGNIREVQALRGISLIAYEGDTIGIIGANGSGKSTLMSTIAGLTSIDSGAIWASSRPSLLGVGAAMLRELSGEKNVVLGGLALGLSMSEIKEKQDAIIDFSGLRDYIDLPMRTYSSGMVERLKFAIAAAREHDILILDEALAVGDSDFRKRAEARMRELAERAGSVFLVSHSMKSILDTCNRAIWLDQGEIKMDGAALDVCRAYSEAAGSPLDD